MPQIPEWAMTLITLSSPVLIAYIGLKSSLGAKKIETRAIPFDVLENRVGKQELQIADLIESNQAKDVEILELRGEITAQHLEIAKLIDKDLHREGEMQAVIDDRDELVAYLTDVALWYRRGATPPPPTVPEHLRDSVPEWHPPRGYLEK